MSFRTSRTSSKIEGATDYTSEGSLYLTTVSIDDSVTFADWVLEAFDDESVVVLKDDITGGGIDRRTARAGAQARCANRRKRRATSPSANSVCCLRWRRVTELFPTAPADGKLEVGDIVLAVDGRPTYTACQVRPRSKQRSAMRSTHRGRCNADKRRHPTCRSTRGARPREPGLPIIGIEMDEKEPPSGPAPQGHDRHRADRGPFGRAMFALTIYDRLTPDDLTNGLEIAGTGSDPLRRHRRADRWGRAEGRSGRGPGGRDLPVSCRRLRGRSAGGRRDRGGLGPDVRRRRRVPARGLS